MQTIREFITGFQFKFLLLILLLASVLLSGLSACGKKGPLYREAPKEQSQQK